MNAIPQHPLSSNRMTGASTPWGDLPPRMKVLFISGPHRTGSWLTRALAADSASDVDVDEAAGFTDGLAKLRDEAFDAVLISHDDAELDALEMLDAIRTGSSPEQPVIVLGEPSEQELAPVCFESGADAYLCVNTTTTRRLLWEVGRSLERHRLIREHDRLEAELRRRTALDHAEADRLLSQQRTMICTDKPARDADATIPSSLVDHYRELLQAYVVMGSGNLAAEMECLAERLVDASIAARQVMLLHLTVLEETVSELGHRSARHVMSRGDMLLVEVMIRLAEAYRSMTVQPAAAGTV